MAVHLTPSVRPVGVAVGIADGVALLDVACKSGKGGDQVEEMTMR